ncbi:MAG: UDP-N-acetylglucosamine 2-epimerase (non-hydrolyzing) [Solirubrobacterales bacterium]|nr:UDP-N-acetylglucosamine 2-epimerase (non-hydrolyzing) [Solirubrobacterales bacterium]
MGTRPNFVKIAPVWRALADVGVDRRLLHTGQHYDRALSGSFLEQLELPEPEVSLGVGSGTHAEQTAGVLVGVERVLLESEHAGVLVAGDVNSTLAAALAACKIGVPIIHLEAGLRSGDWTMPEEINRVLCDRLSDLLLCTSEDALESLAAEGIQAQRAVVVGNTMIDSLFLLARPDHAHAVRERFDVQDGDYVLVTLHRPALVDDPARLVGAMAALAEISLRMPVLFPVHPRTQAHIASAGWSPPAGLRLLGPLTYTDFIGLEAAARLVVTDSGGVQEETSALGVPCLTYRTTTERPITVELGTNTVVGVDPDVMLAAALSELDRPSPDRRCSIPLWDGQAGPRAAEAIARFLAANAQRTRA